MRRAIRLTLTLLTLFAIAQHVARAQRVPPAAAPITAAGCVASSSVRLQSDIRSP
jgi:hypothetical protein